MVADRSPAPDTPELRERWGGFVFTDARRERANAVTAILGAIDVVFGECDR